jgi:serine/threonine protein kinase
MDPRNDSLPGDYDDSWTFDPILACFFHDSNVKKNVKDESIIHQGQYPTQVIDEANEDLETLSNFLKSCSVEVVRPRREPVKYYNYCPRDTVIAYGNKAVAAPMSLRARENEYLAYAEHLENIHEKSIIHRDIKPHNFMLKAGELYIIDFGMSTFYIDEHNEHLTNQGPVNEHIVGSPKYASYNIHEGYAVSRRDDLLSLGYMFLFLYYRELPWDNLPTDLEKENMVESNILHYKNNIRRELKKWDNLKPFLLSRSEINQNILNFLNYCYQLEYQDTPNYDLLMQAFTELPEPPKKH